MFKNFHKGMFHDNHFWLYCTRTKKMSTDVATIRLDNSVQDAIRRLSTLETELTQASYLDEALEFGKMKTTQKDKLYIHHYKDATIALYTGMVIQVLIEKKREKDVSKHDTENSVIFEGMWSELWAEIDK